MNFLRNPYLIFLPALLALVLLINAGKFVLSSLAAEDPYQAFRFHAAGRIVGIGDLHGDLKATRDTLKLAGAINEHDEWIGGNLTVVQVGDQIDRGDEDREILDLLEELTHKAQKAGGQLILLNGNHEYMNVNREFVYVSEGSFKQFLGFPVPTPPLPLPTYFPYDEPGAYERGQAFAPGGHYARMLAKRLFFAIVNDSVFVHGGIAPRHIQYGLVKMQEEAQAWMEGTSEEIPSLIESRDYDSLSPAFYRDFSSATPSRPNQQDCQDLAKSLNHLKANRMIVGHVPQFDVGITSACSDQVWRIDAALSSYYDSNGRPVEFPVQIIEINSHHVEILRSR